MSGLLGGAGLFTPALYSGVYGGGGSYGYRPTHNHHGHHDYNDYGHYKNVDFPDNVRPQIIDNFYEYDKKSNPIDHTKLYERELRLDDDSHNGGYRNFAWKTQ